MKALITGMSSVLGPPAEALLAEHEIEVTPWYRLQTPPEDSEAVQRFVEQEQPGMVFHFALGPVSWAEQLARLCGGLQVPFVFTSTVSVFSGKQAGPFTPASLPEPDDEYGHYKRACEQAILQANPKAHVARIGWQIGHAPGSNNMVDYLETTYRKTGTIQASRNWVQACSFIEDTVEGLYRLARSFPGGLYHLDSNPGLSFYQIVSGLNRLHGNPWKVEESEEPRLDNRLLDDRISLRSITEHFLGEV